jgi:hypothetical protein
MAAMMAPVWRSRRRRRFSPAKGVFADAEASRRKKIQRIWRFVLTLRRSPTYKPRTDGDAALRGALNSVISSFSGRTPPERSTSVAQVENGSAVFRFKVTGCAV